MKHAVLALTALVSTTSSAYAVALDRSGQRINALFETGNHVELSFAYTTPTVSGDTLAAFGGAATGNVADDFLIFSGAIKVDLNDKWSFALIGDEPFGSDILYDGDPAFTILGGTGAIVDSFALTALARYKFNDRISVHGGLRYQEVQATVTTAGFAFNGGLPPGTQEGVNGYRGEFQADGDIGYVIGASYEIPDIALRVSLTYNSSTTHDLPTVETLRGLPASLVSGGLLADESITEVATPESLNLAFQTGIAADTLLFGSVRYARYSLTDVSSALFSGVLTGSPLTDLEDGFDVEIGVGRRFSEKWSGQVSIGFSTVGDDNIISPLGPNNGSQFVSIGGRYNVTESFAISGGVRYTVLGDAFSAPGGNPVATFEDNSAISAGLRFAYKF